MAQKELLVPSKSKCSMNRKFIAYASYLFFLSYFLIACTSSPDAIKVAGQLQWEDENMTGFPAQVLIHSLTDTAFQQEVKVDSVGQYQLELPLGRYAFSLLKHYHWMGEEFIRIDDRAAQFTFEVSTAEVKLPITKLKVIPSPNLMGEKGILHQFDSEKAQQLDAFMKAQMNYFEIPGASIALIKDGKLVYQQVYGVTNSVNKKAVDEKTLFEAGSMTKPVFAFAVCRLAERGILDLDKPLYLDLPFDAVAHDERAKLITARHVLCHQTGFANWPKRNEKGEFDLKFTPGTQFGYSGEAFEYLKRVVAHITQKDISTILEEELLRPLQLENFHFKTNEYYAQHAAHGHKNHQPSSLRHPSEPMMAFSLNTSATAFSKFILALRNGEGLKSSTYAEMLKGHSIREDGTQWGLGFRLEETPFGLSYGHSGSTGRGFISNFCYYPELDMGFVVLTNSQLGGMLVLPLLTDFLILGKREEIGD